MKNLECNTSIIKKQRILYSRLKAFLSNKRRRETEGEPQPVIVCRLLPFQIKKDTTTKKVSLITQLYLG